ncbi:MAG: DNA polymerase III subunit delta [Chloroherpetonaceae bacterium]
MPRKASFNDLVTSISKGKIEPVYFFYGKEDFLMEELIELLRAKVFRTKEEAQANFTVLFGGTGAENSISLGDILSAASAYGMFAEQKMIVVREFDKVQKPKKDLQKSTYQALAEYVKHPLENTVLVLCAGELDKKDLAKEPFSILDSVGYEFPPMRDISGFADDYAKRLGWRLTPEALRLLVMYAGSSARDIGNELQKLTLYAGNREDKTLTEKDVSEVVGISREYNVFELQKAICNRDLRQSSGIALKILEKEEPVSIVNALTVFFTRLWKLHSPVLQRMSEQDAAKELGMSGGQVRFLPDYKQYAMQFTPAELERALVALSLADQTLKGIQPPIERPLLMLKLIREILS